MLVINICFSFFKKCIYIYLHLFLYLKSFVKLKIELEKIYMFKIRDIFSRNIFLHAFCLSLSTWRIRICLQNLRKYLFSKFYFNFWKSYLNSKSYYEINFQNFLNMKIPGINSQNIKLKNFVPNSIALSSIGI